MSNGLAFGLTSMARWMLSSHFLMMNPSKAPLSLL